MKARPRGQAGQTGHSLVSCPDVPRANRDIVPFVPIVPAYWLNEQRDPRPFAQAVGSAVAPMVTGHEPTHQWAALRSQGA
jgi:hypothetical protein